MSHLSQSVSDAIANATGVGGSPPMHQPAADRVKVDHNGEPFYVVCMSEEEMQAVSDGLDVAYDFDEGSIGGQIPEEMFHRLKDRFAV